MHLRTILLYLTRAVLIWPLCIVCYISADPAVDSRESQLDPSFFSLEQQQGSRWNFVTRILSIYQTPSTSTTESPLPTTSATTPDFISRLSHNQRDADEPRSRNDPFNPLDPALESSLRRTFELSPNVVLSVDPVDNSGRESDRRTATTDPPSTTTTKKELYLQRAAALQQSSATLTNSELQANFANAARYQDKDYPYTTSNLTAPPFCSRSTHRSDGLLLYPGNVQDNILNMSLLYRALSCLDVHMLKDSTIQDIFEYVRDRQYFSISSGSFVEDANIYRVTVDANSAANKQFLRRVPWLNPLDGCMSRSEFISTWTYDYMKLPHDAMYKIYLFGNTLQVPTKYTKEGFIRNWVYHMAPMMFSEERGFVILDPSLNHYRPMKLEEWILFMCPGATKLSNAYNLRGFAISNRFAFWPTSSCEATESRYSMKRVFADGYTFIVEDLKWMESLLQDEYKIIMDLGLDPMRYLGDIPPWRQEHMAHDRRLFI